MSWKDAVHHLGRDLLNLLYPSLCLACEGESVARQELFCIHCEATLQITDMHHHVDNEFTRRIQVHPPRFGAAMFRFYPGGRVQELVHQIKYRDHTFAAQSLGRRYGALLREIPLLQDVDLVVPVPLHRRRQRQRGYNQSAYFAAGLAEGLGIPHDASALRRTKATATQTGKNRIDRVASMQHAFEVATPKKLRGKHIMIVDDVLTTGATLESCAEAVGDLPDVGISMATIAMAQ